MSYTDDQLTNALQPYADSFNVILQPIYDQHALFLYLNRSPEVTADCPELVSLLKLQIANQFPKVHVLYFYSRVLGEETIDWQAQFEIPQVKTPRKSARSLKPVNHSAKHSANQVSTPAESEDSDSTLIQERTQGQARQVETAQDTPQAEAVQPSSPAQKSPQADQKPAEKSPVPAASSPEPLLEPEMVVPDPDEFTIHKFRFSRNRLLVEGSLQNPKPDVAEIITFFHELDEGSKRQLLPFLETWFKDPDKADATALPEAWQTWLNRINSEPQRVRSVGVWLSRYCFDPAKAMSQVQATFAGIAQAKAAYATAQQEPEEVEDPEADQEEPSPSQPSAGQGSEGGSVTAGASPFKSSGTVSARSQTKSSAKPKSKSKSKAKSSQSFSPDELLPIGATFFAVLVLGWLISGPVKVMGGFGVLAAFCAIGSGVAFIFGNNSIRGICSITLFLLWLFAPIGLLVIWVELIGGAIGMAIGGAMLAVVKQSEAPSILAPKPVRVAIVAALGLVLVLGPAIFGGLTEGGEASNQNTAGQGQVLVTHVATGSAVRGSQTFEFKGAIAVWDPEEKLLQVVVLPVSVTSGDIEQVQTYFQQEEPEVDLATYLTAGRTSHNPEQFPKMPPAILFVTFQDDASSFNLNTVQNYLLSISWPRGSETEYTFTSSTVSGRQGLTHFSFDPMENGALNLSVIPALALEPQESQDPEGQTMTVELNVRTRVMIRPQPTSQPE